MSEEGNNRRSRGPWTEHSAGGAQDCLYHDTSCHCLRWKEGSDISSRRLSLGSDRSGCTAFPGSGRRFAPSPSYFFEGIVTYMALNIVAFRGRMEKHRGFESNSEQSSEGVRFYYCVWPLYSKN